jgi:putative heme-binding domain-containing protein
MQQLAASDTLRRLTAAEVLRHCHLNDTQLLQALKEAGRDPLVAASNLLPAFHESTATETTKELVDWITEQLQNGWTPQEADLRAFVQRLPSSLQTEGERLLATLQRHNESQSAKLAKYEALLKGGDVYEGRGVFFSAKAACNTCHTAAGQGGTIGPDLTKVGGVRSGRDILESIVFPSSTFAQGFEPYHAIAKDGQEFSGILIRQTPDNVVLREGSGAETVLQRNDIQDLSRSALSIMPEGLETNLTQDEFRNLLAFLQNLK